MPAKIVIVFLCVTLELTCIVIGAETDTNIVGGPPEIGSAVIKQNHALEISRFTDRMFTRTTKSSPPQDNKSNLRSGCFESTTATELVPVLETQTIQVEVSKVSAQRVDGRVIPTKTLVDELAKPKPVILLKQGQQLDPFFLKMFKPDSVILQFSATQNAVPDYIAPTDQSH